MKRIALILVVLGILPLVQSCDFLRKIAGRPTSIEIEAIRMDIERELEGYIKILDSLERENQRIIDSLNKIEVAQTKNKGTGTLVYNQSTMPHKYYVVVGAFYKFKNAEKQLKEIEKRGYKGELITYRNRFTTVGICPSDDFQEVRASLRKIEQSGICREAWIITRK